eukprot:474192_1
MEQAQFFSCSLLKQFPTLMELNLHLAKNTNEMPKIQHVASDNDHISKYIEIFKDKRLKINTEMSQNLNKRILPLHAFSPQDICDTIKQWIYNDIKYEQNLSQMMQLFAKHTLSGQLLKGMQKESIKQLLTQNDFIAPSSLNIMLDYFQKWKTDDINDVKNKSAADIGYILYEYPLQLLLSKILEENIDGETFIDYFSKKKEFIKRHTGWTTEDVYQIESVIFKQNTFKKQPFENNMINILNNTP